MNNLFFAATFSLGAAAVLWMASTFVGANTLALSVTLVIGCVYALGFMELLGFRRATASLAASLKRIPKDIEQGDSAFTDWLAGLHPSLQNAVRLRIEGERVGLPAPVVTPYLVGLLVMLGLLGTFVGMVETLSGAVIALEGTTELQAIRAGLAAPINGLSLAFGTSVAGVAASAMLGLIATLSRRDRMLQTRKLDGKIATVFRRFSLAHNRQETYKALQAQAQVLPDVVQSLNILADKLGKMGERLEQGLSTSQQEFNASTQVSFRELATSVDTSLRESLAQSGRQAGESIKPVLVEAVEEISRTAQATQHSVAQAAQQQQEALAANFAHTSQEVAAAWLAGLSSHEKISEALLASMGTALDAHRVDFERSTQSVLDSISTASTGWVNRLEEADTARLAQWSQAAAEIQQQSSLQLIDSAGKFSEELQQLGKSQNATLAAAVTQFESMSGAVSQQWQEAGGDISRLSETFTRELLELKDAEARRGDAAIERLAALEATAAQQLASLGRELEEPMTRLIEMASETPRAAAEVIGQLRGEISKNIERDNTLLEERSRTMEQLDTLSESLAQSSREQRDVLEKLVASSSELLHKVGRQFGEQVTTEVSQMSSIAEHFAGSATEMASLGDAFTVAVSVFSESNSQLMDKLTQIEHTLDNANTRSDEQMNYYVSQARQIIDQSMRSQREIFEELRQLSAADIAAVAETA